MSSCRPPLRLLLVASLCALAAGCAGVASPSDLRPASHPLLEGVAARSQLLSRAPRPAAAPVDPAQADRARRQVVGRLAALEGKRSITGTPATDLGLVRAAFAGSAPSAADARTVRTLRRSGRTVRGTARPGDVLFFEDAGGAPATAVVRRVDGGVIEALAVTRGAVRTIRIAPDRPHARRDGDLLLNTFIRARRKGDEPGAAYLAGQLLRDIRSFVD